jgi:hypothetical protein
LTSSTHNGGNSLSEELGIDFASDSNDVARALEARNIGRPPWWGWIEASALEEVGGIQTGRANTDHDVAWAGIE